MKESKMTIKAMAIAVLSISALLTSVEADALKGRGASFPGPVYKAWTSEYFAATNHQVNYTPTGSGDGIKSIKKRMVDFAGTDKPLKSKSLKKSKLHMFPTTIGAVVLAYNLDGVKDGELKLSRKAIAGIFTGRISFWDHKDITKENPSLLLPHEPITVVVRADKSGTTYNFTYFLHRLDRSIKVSKKPTWKAKKVVAGKSNAGVSANIQQIKNSIGYIEYSYKEKLGLSAAQIQNLAKFYITPSLDSFKVAAKYVKWSAKDDFYAIIGDPAGSKSYPIVAATFLLLPKDTKTNKEVTRFMDWAYTHGDEAALKLGYVPLSSSTKDAIRKYWKSNHLM